MVFLRHRRGLLAASLVLAVLVVLANLAIPWLFGRAVEAIEHGEEQRVVTLGVAVIAVGVVRAPLAAMSLLSAGRLAVDVERSVRGELYGRLLSLDSEFHDRRKVGELVSRLMITSRPIRTFLSQSLPQMATDALTFVVAGTAIAITDPALAAAAFWPVPIVVYLVARFGVVMTPLMRERQEREGEVTAQADDTLRGIRTVVLLGAQEDRAHHFEAATSSWRSVADDAARRSAWYDASIVSLPDLAWAGLYAWGGWSAIQGDLPLGTLVAFLGYLAVMLGPVRGLGTTLWRTQNAAASATRVFEILDLAPTVSSRGTDAIDDEAAPLQITELTKTYDGRVRALDQGELDIAAGRNVVVVGRTGSGKSALLQVIGRLYEPEQGDVLIDGRPIERVTLSSLRANVRVVASSPRIFPTSIWDNLVYGATDAEQADVERVCRALGLHAHVVQLPHGYETRVGEGGSVLPLPVAQLVSLARSLITDQAVLLLDDVTALLPPEMACRAVEGIRAATEQTTVVAVTNRPAMLDLADDVVVMDRGAMVAHGSTEHLLRTSPQFRELVALWRTGASAPPGASR